MTDEVVLGPIAQIPPGEGRIFMTGSEPVAVFHMRSGAVFATQARCPHRDGPLADGLTDEASVVCPLHDRVYDLRTGAGIGTDCGLRTYPVRLAADGTILLVPAARQPAGQPAMAEAG